MCRAHGAIFVLACAALIGADAKKPKKKSDLMVLVEIQEGWKMLWKNATLDVATKCKASCDWAHHWDEETRLREASEDLVKRAPEYKATLAVMLQMTKRGFNPIAHHASCRPSHVHGRDDFCICAREHKDWQTECDYAVNTGKCQKFLSTVCDISFTQDDEDIVLSKGADIAERYKILKEKAKRADEPQTGTQKLLKRLQGILDNLDKEHQQLIDAHAETTKDMQFRPLLANLEKRIKAQKDKVLKEMQEVLGNKNFSQPERNSWHPSGEEFQQLHKEADAEKEFERRLKMAEAEERAGLGAEQDDQHSPIEM